MLKSIRLKNFKLHEDTSIEAARINVFIGPNNSGKSSIFQALLTLRQAGRRRSAEFLRPVERQATSTAQPYLFPAREVIDLGEFKNVVRQGESEVQISISGAIQGAGRFLNQASITLSFQVGIRENRLAYHSGNILFAGNNLVWERFAGPPSAIQIPISLDGSPFRFSPVDSFQLIGVAGYQIGSSVPQEQQAELISLANYLAEAPIHLLNSVRSVSPLRGFEEWAYWTPDDPAENLDWLSLPDRSVALASALASNSRLKRQISQRLEEFLGVGIETELVRGKRVKLWAAPQGEIGSERLFSNEGTGANQLPFIFVPIALARSGETILLSEPEAHLHPKAQSELTSLLLTFAEKQKLQFFIETHSEHVLHKLLHAVAKRDLAKENLAIYYFANESGVARIEPLKINDQGQVEGGLRGFYDQSLTELTDFLDALKKP